MSPLPNAVKSHPFPCRDWEVRAILEGRKTQKRVLVRPQPPSYIDALHGDDLRRRAPYRVEHPETGLILGNGFQDDNDRFYLCPVPGDELWVRETWGAVTPVGVPEGVIGSSRVVYRSDNPDDRPLRWRPSTTMPRWASRITLEVTGVRVQRLQDIREADAIAEGCESSFFPAFVCGGEILLRDGLPPVEQFAQIWDSQYSHLARHIRRRKSCEKPTDRYNKRHPTTAQQYSWSANPWVWVIEFERKD